MSDAALPPHLRGRKHNDWPFFLRHISRGWNAIGPRAPFGAKDHMAWPPKLIEGQGVARWESAGGDSILHIPALEQEQVKGFQVYGRNWLATEMNPGKPDFMKSRDVFIADWQPANVFDLPDPYNPNRWIQKCEPGQYSPSALQMFSNSGWMTLSPHYHAEWRILKKRELPVWPETGEDTVFFWRRGARPDHVDLYYNTDKVVPIGFIGLKWE